MIVRVLTIELLISVVHVQVILILKSMLVMPKSVRIGVVMVTGGLVAVMVVHRLLVRRRNIFFVVELV